MFIRCFHCVMRAEHSAHVFQRRNKTRHTQIAIIRRFWSKSSSISLPFVIFLRLNALLTALCVQNVVNALSSVETSRDTRKSQSFVDFVQYYDLFPSRLRYFDDIFTAFCVRNVVHAFSNVETSQHTRKSQTLVDFDENYAIFLSSLRYFGVHTLFSLRYERRT